METEQSTAAPALKIHPLADLFPSMTHEEYRALVADMKERGQDDPLTLFEGMVLDGRNRYAACLELGIEPRTEMFTGTTEEALRFVLAKNLLRRHLSTSQRSMVAAKIATMRQGERTDLKADSEPSTNSAKVSQQAAADQLKVGISAVKDAKAVLDHGTPELVKAVETGGISVSAAAAVADLPPEQQTQIATEKDPAKLRVALRAATKKPVKAGWRSYLDVGTVDLKSAEQIALLVQQCGGLRPTKELRQLDIPLCFLKGDGISLDRLAKEVADANHLDERDVSDKILAGLNRRHRIHRRDEPALPAVAQEYETFARPEPETAASMETQPYVKPPVRAALDRLGIAIVSIQTLKSQITDSDRAVIRRMIGQLERL